ncbi:MAG TPA: hypothetical protein VGE74_28530 [Gemmata sp.]
MSRRPVWRGAVAALTGRYRSRSAEALRWRGLCGYATVAEQKRKGGMRGSKNRVAAEPGAAPDREIGAVRLVDLGVTDPVYFVGWDGMAELGREIGLLRTHLRSIEYQPEMVARWPAHLVYCHRLLSLATPGEGIPDLCIG